MTYGIDTYSDKYKSYTTGMVRVENETEWITTSKAAEIMGVTKQAVQRLCRDVESFDCEKFGRDWMVNKASAEAYKLNPGGRGKKTKIDDDNLKTET